MEAYFDEIRDHPEPTGRWIPGDLDLLFLAGDEWSILDGIRSRLETAKEELPAAEQQELSLQTQAGARELSRRWCRPDRHMSQTTGRSQEQTRIDDGEGAGDEPERFGGDGSWEFR